MDTVFNGSDRTQNIKKTFWGYAVSYVVSTAAVFIYRTVFVRILSREYLGIEGLFGNVMQILSFAELGIGNLIAWYLYEPIKNHDIKSVAEWMKLYRVLYRAIACVIAVSGLLFFNCLTFFLKDRAELPGDIQMKAIYLLFLIQCVSGYLFSDRQTLLAADQRGGALAVCLCVRMLLQYLGQCMILIRTRDYTAMMAGAVVIGVLYNALLNAGIARRYRPVFEYPCKTPYSRLKAVWRDVGAMLFHRIGATVVNSTDNLILAAHTGLGRLGHYADYSLVTGSIQSMLGKVLGNFNGSIGNAHAVLPKKERYRLYRKLHLINLWIVSVVSVCLYALLDDAIVLWQGQNILCGTSLRPVLVLNFFLGTARFVNISYINASGLFNRDLVRPLIEAAVNLVLSVLLVKNLGISGVILGTAVSTLFTVWWREPYLLYRYEFEEPLRAYWAVYIKFSCAVFFLCVLVKTSGLFHAASLQELIGQVVLLVTMCNIVLAIANRKDQDFLSLVRTKKENAKR